MPRPPSSLTAAMKGGPESAGARIARSLGVADSAAGNRWLLCHVGTAGSLGTDSSLVSSAVPDRRPNDDGGSKLSPQTLIVASLASLTAAIVTSTFWQRGTPITAAITPVLVAIASELYSRPARRITELSSRAGQVHTG